MPPSTKTCTLTLADDGLLRFNASSTDAPFSPTLYVDWLKDIVAAVGQKPCCKQMQIC